MFFTCVTIVFLISTIQTHAQSLQTQNRFYLNDRIYFDKHNLSQVFQSLDVKDSKLPFDSEQSSVDIYKNNVKSTSTTYGFEQKKPGATQFAQLPNRQNVQDFSEQASQLFTGPIRQVSTVLPTQAPIVPPQQGSSLLQSVQATHQAGYNIFLYSITDFGLNLMKNIKQVGNVVISPYSISAVLALLQLGAEGQTQEQITTALNLTPSESVSSFTRISEDFKNRNYRTILKTASNVYVANGFTLNSGFKNIAQNNFDSDVTLISFTEPDRAASKINNWVASQTNNKIETLVSPESLDVNTQVMLVNAIYFKGLWEIPFRVKATKNREFRLSNGAKKMVPFMNSRRMLKAGIDPSINAKVAILPFENKQYSLMLIIPSSLIGMTETLAQLSSARLLSYQSFNPIETALHIPKFTVRSDTDLIQVIRKLGVTNIFGPHSELSKLGNYNSYIPQISSAVHSAVISIDEEGGSAAAATSFAAVALSNEEPSLVFLADKPFVAVLWDEKTNLPLFMAKIEDPTAQ